MTPAEYRAALRPGFAARRKFGNTPTVVDGVRYDSAKESRRIGELKLLERAGRISDLTLQPRFKLAVNGQHICTYVADASYRQDGRLVVEDVKSPATAALPVFRIKRALMRAIHGIVVVLT